jgi:hypothetical protein
VLFSILLFQKARITPFRTDTTKLYVFSGLLAGAGLALGRLPGLATGAGAIGLAVVVVVVWVLGALFWRPFKMEWAEIRKIAAMRNRSQTPDTSREPDPQTEEALGPSPDTESGI